MLIMFISIYMITVLFSAFSSYVGYAIRTHLNLGKKYSIRYLALCSIIPYVNIINIIDEYFCYKSYLDEKNKIKNCKVCEITSRKWQVGENYICPHCSNNIGSYDWSESDKSFPFARKFGFLKGIHLLRIEASLSKARSNQQEVCRIDSEIEAYQNLLIKQLEDEKKKVEMEMSRNNVEN